MLQFRKEVVGRPAGQRFTAELSISPCHSGRVKVGVQWNSWVEALDQTAAMADQALPLLAVCDRNDYQLNTLEPRHLAEAEATRSGSSVIAVVHP